MKKRIITGFCIAAVIVPAVYFGGIFFLIVGLFLSGVAGYEMMRMFYKDSPTLKYLQYIVPIFCMLLVLLIYFSATRGLSKDLFEAMINEDGTVIASNGNMTFEAIRKKLLYHFWVITAFIIAIIICTGCAIFTKGSKASDIMACLTTLCYCGLVMGYAVCVEYLQPIASSSVLPTVQFGGRSFAYVFVIVCVTDTIAYFFGKKFGKTKLCPNISPNKTVAGAIAGLIAGSLVGSGIAFLFQLVFMSSNNVFWVNLLIYASTLILSAIISLAGQLGDLIASKFKRSYNIKDYGKIFPGHGGVLDRFDSLILAGAVYYVLIQVAQLLILGAA